MAGPISAVLRVLSIITDLGPPLGLHINLSKCELFSVNDLSRFPIYTRGPNRQLHDLIVLYSGCDVTETLRRSPLLSLAFIGPHNDVTI